MRETVQGRCQKRVSKKQSMMEGAASVKFSTMNGAKVGAPSDSLVDLSKLLGHRVKCRFRDARQVDEQEHNQVAVANATAIVASEVHNFG